MTRVSNRRLALKATAALIGALAVPAAMAQVHYPHGPLKLIVPLPAGGAVDAAARATALELEKQLKQPVIIDNRPGGAFQIAMQALLAAPADGQTLIHLNSGMVAVQAVQKRYDLNKQLIPLTVAGESQMVLVVGPKSPFKTLKELVDYARANPGKVSHGTPGPGSGEHLKVAQMEKAAGVQLLHVPYKGGPDVAKAVIGGEVDFAFTVAIFAAQFAPKGQMRVLAVFDPVRMKEFPDVPTIAETGVPAGPTRFWGGFAVRAGTPAPIVERLSRELQTAILAPPVVDRLAPLGMMMTVSKTPTDFQRQIAADAAWMDDVAKGLNLAVN